MKILKSSRNLTVSQRIMPHNFPQRASRPGILSFHSLFCIFSVDLAIQDIQDVVFHSFGSAKVVDQLFPGLADAVDAADGLLDAHGVPQQVIAAFCSCRYLPWSRSGSGLPGFHREGGWMMILNVVNVGGGIKGLERNNPLPDLKNLRNCSDVFLLCRKSGHYLFGHIREQGYFLCLPLALKNLSFLL